VITYLHKGTGFFFGFFFEAITRQTTEEIGVLSLKNQICDHQGNLIGTTNSGTSIYCIYTGSAGMLLHINESSQG